MERKDKPAGTRYKDELRRTMEAVSTFAKEKGEKDKAPDRKDTARGKVGTAVW